jgi:hypothetical protein
MELERIVNLMVKNHKTLERRNTIDMSMFPEDSVQPIFSAAAEKALEQGNLDAVSNFLYQGKIWDRMLELGKKYFHSTDEENRKTGKGFLEILMCHHKLPKDIAIELGNDILKNDGEYSRYRAVMAFKAGNALKRAEEVAYELLGGGNFEDGFRFLSLAKKDLSDAETRKYANIALKNKRYTDCLAFHQSITLDMSVSTALKLIEGDEKIFDDVIKYMDEMDESFSKQDFMEFGEGFFNKGKYDKSLEMYKRAGDAVEKNYYKTLGERILASEKPNFHSACDFLSAHNKKDAKKRLLDIANELQVYEDIARFEGIYGILKMKLPADLAEKAAEFSEAKGKYSEAAKFYEVAGKNDKVREMGNRYLESDDSFDVRYNAEQCFEMIKDKEGLAVTKFYKKNIRDC